MKKTLVYLPFITVTLAILLSQGTALSNQEISDSNPSLEPQVIIPKPFTGGIQAKSSESLTVYFTPQDENTSTTVLFLYNTGSDEAVVNLQTYQTTGALFIDTDITVPSLNLVRICADTVSTIAGSWQDALLVNFTTLSSFAKMILPKGVKIDGYVVWNDAATYDPLKLAHTLPLMFTTEKPEESSRFFVIPVKPGS